jgi:hypothetical protein
MPYDEIGHGINGSNCVSDPYLFSAGKYFDGEDINPIKAHIEDQNSYKKAKERVHLYLAQQEVLGNHNQSLNMRNLSSGMIPQYQPSYQPYQPYQIPYQQYMQPMYQPYTPIVSTQILFWVILIILIIIVGIQLYNLYQKSKNKEPILTPALIPTIPTLPTPTPTPNPTLPTKESDNTITSNLPLINSNT